RRTAQYLRELLIRRKLRASFRVGNAKQARQRRESRRRPRLLTRHELTCNRISCGLFLSPNLGCSPPKLPRRPLNRSSFCEPLPRTSKTVSTDCSTLNAGQCFRAQKTPHVF